MITHADSYKSTLLPTGLFKRDRSTQTHNGLKLSHIGHSSSRTHGSQLRRNHRQHGLLSAVARSPTSELRLWKLMMCLRPSLAKHAFISGQESAATR